VSVLVAPPDAVTPRLTVRGLRTYICGRRGVGKAVDGVSFTLAPGETLGLVGESGSGKSLTSMSLVRLLPRAARIVEGDIRLDGLDLLALPLNAMRQIRGARIAVVLQDALTALNPVLTIGEQIYEPLRQHQGLGGRALRARAVELLRMMRIPAPEARLRAFPHQMSGGMRQRALGAVALAAGPEVLIADEPTTALDPTLEAAFLEYIKQIQRERGMSILLTTHDLNVVARACHRVAVMYAGRIVETGTTRQIMAKPAHPYTEGLLAAVPDVRRPAHRLIAIPGQPPSIYAEKVGCSFAARCPYVMDRCRTESPPDFDLPDGRSVACWRYA